MLVAALKWDHRNLEKDLKWLEDHLAEDPMAMGDHVPKVKFRFPIFKARCKDTCCRLAAQEGWRVLYAVDRKATTVYLCFLVHKKEVANPGPIFIGQMIERAFKGAETKKN